MTLNRDTIVAICLLMFCGVMFWASTEIRDPGFEQMGAEVWPRIVLVLLTGLSLVYLVQSLGAGPTPTATDSDGEGSWLARYQNPIWCFALFFGFLLSIPYLGMLVGGMLFVFLMMSVLGGWTPRLMAMHAAIAIVAVGAMWSIFTFGLRVMLPEGELFQLF